MKTTFNILSLVTLCLVFFAACGKNNSSGKSNKSDPYSNNLSLSSNSASANRVSANQLVALVNQYRKEHRLRTLVRDSLLDADAQSYANDMGDGRSRFASFKMSYCVNGRGTGCNNNNLNARYHTTPKQVLDSWLESPRLRRALLDPEIRRVGVGVSQSRAGRPYWAISLN